MEDWKIKIAVLWLVGMLAALTRILISLVEPGKIEQIMAGQFAGMTISPVTMLLLAVIFLIPLVMAFLSLVLRDSVNRWANIIVGLVYVVLGIIDLVRYIASAYAVLLNLTFVAAILVVWYAWKSKQKT